MKPIESILVEYILKSEYQLSTTIIGLIPFGSITYGTITETSDRDMVVIVDHPTDLYIQYETNELDLHIMSLDTFRTRLYSHDILALEVYYNTSPIIALEHIDFVVDKVKLRHTISAVVSNSWVKAKKKVMLSNEDNWLGYKSLFHSIRILDFGIQLASEGKISDYKRHQPTWDKIMSMVDDNTSMHDMMQHFKPSHNKNATYFRELAPKN